MVTGSTQQDFADEFSNVVIRASAGTGKTFALSNRYLQLLASGVECQSILATTFTKKGAGEILDRIVERLSAAALDEAAAKQLSQELQWKLTQARAADILHDLLRSLHRLEISTLDSFFSRVAKVFSLELGLPPTWEIVEEQQMHRLYDQAIQSVLHDTSVTSLLHMLSKGEAARRVATLIHATVDQIYTVFRESGPLPWDQVPTTGKFLTDEKLNGLMERIEALQLPLKSLINHWAVVTSLAQQGDWVGLASTTSFQNVLDGNFKYGRTKLPAEVVEIYQQLLPHCIAFVEQRLIQQNHSTRDLLMAFGARLDEAKNATGDLRFDDVTERLQQFVSRSDTDHFAFRLDHQIQHLLLDEFQDTSLSQWNVIRPFARKVTEAAEKVRSFFCVGDMKQAIFGWRGGIAEIFDLVDSELPNLAEPQALTTSYRSAQPVIDVVNQIFLNVDQYQCGDEISEFAIRQWSKWFSEHTTTKSELAGYVSIEMASECPASVKQFSDSKDSSRNENVNRATVQRIKSLTQSLPADKTIGVIVRTNGEVGRLIFELQKAGVPASEEGGNPLTDSAAVELILSALTLADHPGDSLARFHLSHSPLAGCLGLEPENDSNQAVNALTATASSARLRGQLVDEGYGPTIEGLARALTADCTQRELIRLQQLVQVAYSSSANRDWWQLRPQRFVAYVRDEVKVSDQSSAQVRVMTIHKAKGLEFDVVVLPIPVTSSGWAGMVPNVVVGRERPTAPIQVATRYVGEGLRKLLPENFREWFAEDRRRNVREAMCVLYVALTRAKQATHVIVSHGAKLDHKSAGGILLATVCPDAKREEGLLYEHGNAQWFASDLPKESETANQRGDGAQAVTKSKRKKPKKTAVSQSDSAASEVNLQRYYLPESAQLTRSTIRSEIQSGRGVPRTAPSSMPGRERQKLSDIFQTAGAQEILERGTQLHACFELVHWLDQSVPSKQQLAEHLNQLHPTSSDFNSVLNEFYKCLKNDHVAALLNLKSYQQKYLLPFSADAPIVLEAQRIEVATERRFAVQLDSEMLSGVIDRLLLIYNGDQLIAADVIDFKTENVDETDLQQRVEFYRPQLNRYRQAAAKFCRLPLIKISTRLLFVRSGQLVNLDLVENSFSAEQAAQMHAGRHQQNKSAAGSKGTPQTKGPHDSRRPTKKREDLQQTLWPEE